MSTAFTFPALTTGVFYVNSAGITKAGLVIVTPDTVKPGHSLELDAELGQIVVKVLNVAAHDYSRVVASKAAVEAGVAKAQAEVDSEDAFAAAAAAEFLSAHLAEDGTLKRYWTPIV